MKHNIFFFNDKVCLCGDSLPHNDHSHFLLQIVLIEVEETKDLLLEIIPPCQQHNMNLDSGRYFTMLLDPLSYIGKSTLSSAKEIPKHIMIDDLKLLNLFDDINDSINYSKASVISNKLINTINKKATHFFSLDKRIKRTLRYLYSLDSYNISSRDIHKIACLSESHFNSLFKKNVGISLSRFLLWLKLYRSVISILSGNDFTYAAHSGGFVDSSHFAKTFKSNTGLPLSSLFKNQRMVQVHTK